MTLTAKPVQRKTLLRWFNMTALFRERCCDLVYWKHEDGWDVYRRSDCREINGHWVPNWFDDFVIEDAPTKAEAMAEIKSRHILGICLVNS